MFASLVAFFRRRQNLPVLLIPLLLLLWARFAAPQLGEASFRAVALFPSPYTNPLPNQGLAADPVAEHVLIIVVDGLRVDVSRQMPTLNALRQQGADRILTVGQPSFSLPGWTVLGTGAWQEQSGVTTNFYADSLEIETIFETAKRAGLSTALVGHEQWGQLYVRGIDDERLTVERDDVYTNLEGDLQFDRDTADLALEALAQQENLTLVHLLSVDSVAHGWGGTSAEEMQAAQNADAQIARILEAVDLTNTAVFITADHGHIDRGGHGGWEESVLRIPLVSAGQGILPDSSPQGTTYPQGAQADVAPTLAALLGAPIPGHSQGRILFDQLQMPESLKASRAVDLARQITQRYDAMIETIGDSRRVDGTRIASAHAALEAGDTAAALTESAAVVDSAYALWNTARADRLNTERIGHIAFALVLLVPLVLYLLWWRRERWGWRAPLIGAVLYFAIWNAIYFLIDGNTYSISMFNVESNITAFITGRVIRAVVALALSGILVAVLRRRAPYGEVVRDVVHMMFLVAAALGVQILIYFALWDVIPYWALPDLFWAFKYYLDLYQTSAFWPLLPLPLAALLPLLALGVAWLARKLAPTKP